ncbi:spindle assembly abnormal protein 6 homolog [Anabrus simplex]|uniref:spindle assembly abnormal protein 6 homolog n=1 Tax=Anabrus simplex TaxID=316456 RepID=UPI0035A26AE3
MSSAGHILFSDVLKLYVKSPDERERVVRINVELLSGSSPVGEKSVCVKVTDEEDPFFFYGITVNHDEFQSLKSHQNLLIEFNKFPEQLVHLLKQCCTKVDSPKYLLLLEEDSSESVLASHQLYLKFVEKNDFKQLCHLALKVGDPSNAELKEYMASKIKSLKDAAIKSDRKISLLEAELAKMKSDLAVACSVQDENNKKWLEEKNALEIAHVREITAERERLADAKLLWQKEEEQRKANEQKDVGDRIRKLELEITTVRAQYDETRDKLSAAKEQIFKLSEELSTKSSELAGLRQELPLLRKRNIVLDKDYHEKQKQLAMANADNMQLRQELNERASEAANYLAEVVSVREEKAELKNNFDIQARECQLLLRQNEELRQDVFKANSIICNVRGQFDDVCRELLLKNTMLAQQEKLLAEKERNIQELGGELKHAVEKVKMLQTCRDDLNQQLHSAAEQLKVKDRELENNKNGMPKMKRQLKCLSVILL